MSSRKKNNESMFVAKIYIQKAQFVNLRENKLVKQVTDGNYKTDLYILSLIFGFDVFFFGCLICYDSNVYHSFEVFSQ
jgi:hypothetical protein